MDGQKTEWCSPPRNSVGHKQDSVDEVFTGAAHFASKSHSTWPLSLWQDQHSLIACALAIA